MREREGEGVREKERKGGGDVTPYIFLEAGLSRAVLIPGYCRLILCENRFNLKTIFKAILATLERTI